MEGNIVDEKLKDHFDKIDNCIRKASIAIHEIYDEWNKFRSIYLLSKSEQKPSEYKEKCNCAGAMKVLSTCNKDENKDWWICPVHGYKKR